MTVEKTFINDLVIIAPGVFEDSRGVKLTAKPNS